MLVIAVVVLVAAAEKEEREDKSADKPSLSSFVLRSLCAAGGEGRSQQPTCVVVVVAPAGPVTVGGL